MHKREEWVMTVQEREGLLDLIEDVSRMAAEGIEGEEESQKVYRITKEVLQILHGEWI